MKCVCGTWSVEESKRLAREADNCSANARKPAMRGCGTAKNTAVVDAKKSRCCSNGPATTRQVVAQFEIRSS